MFLGLSLWGWGFVGLVFVAVGAIARHVYIRRHQGPIALTDWEMKILTVVNNTTPPADLMTIYNRLEPVTVEGFQELAVKEILMPETVSSILKRLRSAKLIRRGENEGVYVYSTTSEGVKILSKLG